MSKKSIPRSEILFQKIQAILEEAKYIVYQKTNSEMLRAYWNIGKEIMEEEQNGLSRAKYGIALLEELAMRLSSLYGKSVSSRNLRYMRQFYREFPKWNAVSSELSWTHYRLLLKVENENAREFYLDEAIAGNWSTRQLERQINSLYFDRLLIAKDKTEIKLVCDNVKDSSHPEDIIKDPFVLEFLDVKENETLAESDLESALIEKLKHFLLELGNGFSFVGRQYRITADNDHYYIDLVFYNYILKCFLLIDLKTEKLTHQDIGQMDFYIRFFEDQIKQPNDNPSIGLILCTEKNKTIVKYSLLNESKQIFASKYQLYLPTTKQLEQEISRERLQIEQEKDLL
ncbi:PDDEXK nuclease domain-containing protein [Algoriphagus sp.]|uniref:PDDEXK nuclease domain-containing protein n=1 Tax=Algoriphagus sp. TaxID=1872435 RepID=UPI0025E39BE7|nr:PDDEXK nuclease domain-containing protein [Algoriphagus sp.]